MAMADELVDDVNRAVEWLDHHFTFSDTQVCIVLGSFRAC